VQLARSHRRLRLPRYASAMTPAGQTTLVIFCRRPARHAGKQRIAATLGADFTLALAKHLLATALEDALTWPGPVVLSPASLADAAWAGTLLPTPVRIVPQSGGNLGQRLNQVDRAVRDAGAGRVIYIGTDAPLLDYAFYARARMALDLVDVVVGPAEDGGVTLMGARYRWPELDDLPWSTPGLGEALELRCRSRGLSVDRLALHYDLDEADQLDRLRADLARDVRPARVALRDWLDSGMAPPASPAREHRGG
jgi:glycosyltransferase A (GT-A) superfamily protein (DUF2064 family)